MAEPEQVSDVPNRGLPVNSPLGEVVQGPVSVDVVEDGKALVHLHQPHEVIALLVDGENLVGILLCLLDDGVLDFDVLAHCKLLSLALLLDDVILMAALGRVLPRPLPLHGHIPRIPAVVVETPLKLVSRALVAQLVTHDGV